MSLPSLRLPRYLALWVALGLSAFALLSPCLLARYVQSLAANRGWALHLHSAYPSLRGFSFSHLEAQRQSGRARLALSLDSLVLPWSELFSHRSFSLERGKLLLEGTPEDLRQLLRASSHSSRNPSTARRSLELHDVDVSYSESLGGPPVVDALGLNGHCVQGGLCTGTVRKLTVRGPSSSLEASGISFEGMSSSPFVVNRVQSKKFAMTLHRSSPLAEVKVGEATPQKHDHEEPTLKKMTSSVANIFDKARKLSQDSKARLTQHLGAQAELATEELLLRIEDAGERLELGPASMRVTRRDDSVILELQSSATGKGTLSLRAEESLSEDESLKLQAHVGPITLGSLGIVEGAFGFIDVDKVLLAVELEGQFTGKKGLFSLGTRGSLSSFGLARPWLSTEAIHDFQVGWEGRVRGELNRPALHIEQFSVNIGRAKTLLSGSIDADNGSLRFRGSFEVPLGACQDFLDALPRGFAPLLAGIGMDGTFGTALGIDYDGAHSEAASVRWTLQNGCRFSRIPPRVGVEQFFSPFILEVKDAQGRLVQRAFGPSSGNFTPIREISRYVPVAVTVCEDGRFLHHSGIDLEALKSAFRDNLRSQRFQRGGSTVTMQLAKNLYLRKDKTLSRKVQEAVLTLLLEQSLSKEQIMELYLNVIEFGPGVYGITEAASHYFDTTPSRLSLAQSLYLVSILPNPKHHHFTPEGPVSPGWANLVRRLVGIAEKRGQVTEAEAEAARVEELRFRTPSELPSPENNGDFLERRVMPGGAGSDDDAYGRGVIVESGEDP